MLRLWARLRTVAHDRRFLAFMIALGVLVSARELASSPLFRLDQQLIDYRVFWCGGQAALGGADPYVTEPLRTCEHRYAAPFLATSPNLVLPFVLPPYDIPVFEAFARLPFDVSGALFTALSILALAASVVLVAASARAPIVLCAVALCMSVGLPSVALGQIVPLELLGLAATAFALARERDAWAGACAVLTLLEPHVGAFVVIAVALFVPRARIALGIGLAVLALVAVLVSAAIPTSYLAALASHAAAEARSGEQYSLTYVLRYVRAPADLALALGAASTFAALAAALALSSTPYRRGLRSAAVYIPAACAVCGGTFVHVTQIALAVPAALLLFRHGGDRATRTLGALAVVLLAIPWPYPVLLKQALAPALVVLAVTAWYTFRERLRPTVAVVAACWLILIPIENRPPPAAPAAVLQRSPGTALASVPWAEALAQMPPSEPRDLLVKIPTWTGLLACLGAALALALRAARESSLRAGMMER